MGNKTKKQKFNQGGSKKSHIAAIEAMFGDPMADLNKLKELAKKMKKNQDKGKKYKNPRVYNQGGSNMGKKKMKNGGGIKEAISNFLATGTKPVLEQGKGARPGLSVKEKEKLKRQKMFDKNTTKTNMDLNSNPFKAKKKSTLKAGTVIKSSKSNTKKSVSSVAKKKLADVSKEDMIKAGFTSFGKQSLRKYLNMKNKLGKKPTKSDFDSKKNKPNFSSKSLINKKSVLSGVPKSKKKAVQNPFKNPNPPVVAKKQKNKKVAQNPFKNPNPKMNKGGTFKGIF